MDLAGGVMEGKAGDDSPGNLIGGGMKWAHQHARTIRREGWTDAFGVDGGGFQSELRLRNRGREHGKGVLRELHFREGEQEGKRGFRALVAVDPIHV